MPSYSRSSALSVALCLSVCLGTTARTAIAEPGVTAADETIVIPTYEMGPADANPMFYTNESYQGAQKRIYPYALQDHLTRDRRERSYRALRLENEYIQVVVLPELGGRLFAAIDKTNGYDFFYRQHVIKPALIGMLGAWISGGIEWCAFHHHRNTTFMTVDATLVDNPDGSKTIVVGETERRHRMKWLIGITLRPGRSYLEVTGRFFNRTAMPHSILYWANVAVHVNEDYRIIFPPSVQVATYHSKIDFIQWPIGRGTYRGNDYDGVDLSWWKNHRNPISFFAWNLRENFMGGYDHGKAAGVVHVGDHHTVSGAKLWEWGTGAAGRMWDGILTDEDGPYAELMVGAFSDNQPDYSWIKPGEVKTFRQLWYPVRDIGGFKNANIDGAVNLELLADGKALVGFHTTASHEAARVRVEAASEMILDETVVIGPDAPFRREIDVPGTLRPTEIRASLSSATGEELIAYQPIERSPVERLPERAKSPPSPADVETIEELCLTGLRVEQIHNPTVDPRDYYEEAIRRDPGDSRSNTMLALHHLKRGQPAEAEQHLRAAIERLSAEYTRPGDARVHYYMGLAMKAQRKLEDAVEQFHRATWDRAVQSVASLQLGGISCDRRDFRQALEHVDRALSTAALNTRAWSLRAAVLRKLGRSQEARHAATSVLSVDPLDFLALHELALAQEALAQKAAAASTRARLRELMRGEVQSYLELAADYLDWGLWDEAIAVLEDPVSTDASFVSTYPLVHYYLGYLEGRRGDSKKAVEHYARAMTMPPAYCFPFRLETRDVLEAALRANPDDARANYYLGNLLFELQPDRAIEFWERSRSLDETLALVHRNLGWAYRRVKNDLGSAMASYEKAIQCDGLDPRLFYELDVLYEIANVSPNRRLAMLEQNHDVVVQRNDSLAREIRAQVLTGKYEAAIDSLDRYFFHVREGGGEIRDVYVDAHLLRGIGLLIEKRPAEALYHFERAAQYPENLSVGRPKNDRRAPQVAYYSGLACQATGQSERAGEYFRAAVAQEGTSGWPETRYYQALCQRQTGEEAASAAVFDELISRGKNRLEGQEGADFFAKFGEQETRQARRAAAHYAFGLGYLGRGDADRAREQFAQAVKLNSSHVWARHELGELEDGE